MKKVGRGLPRMYNRHDDSAEVARSNQRQDDMRVIERAKEILDKAVVQSSWENI
jgi:hypothetical protein